MGKVRVLRYPYPIISVTNSHSIRQIDIVFETLSVPPPYSHQYTFQLRFEKDAVQVKYELQYTDRDELTEEEVWEEGFTPEDDYHWQGGLPQVWQATLLEHWGTTEWIAPEEAKNTPENALLITTVSDDEGQQVGIPKLQARWEYLLQELTQAVYEAAQREHPLQLRYLERKGATEALSLTLRASFLQRSLEVDYTEGGHTHHETPSWSTLEPLLNTIYLLDYDSEKATTKPPTRSGQYLDPGDGHWYAFGKQVTNVGTKNHLAEIERFFSGYRKRT